MISSACFLPVHGQDSISCGNTCTDKGNTPSEAFYGQKERKLCAGCTKTIHFRFDKVEVDSGYADNRQGLRVISSLFSDSARVSFIDSIHVYAYSSPEGKESYNKKLAVLRAEAMKKYLIGNYPLLEQRSINLFPKGENREGFYNLILADKNFAERDEVLMILDKVKDSDKQERLIKRLNGGRAYSHIRKHILPKLRIATVCTVWVDNRLTTKIPLPPMELKGLQSSVPIDAPLLPLAVKLENKKRYSALKTNLAAWAAGCVNLAYETQLGKHLSVDIPLMWSSWDVSRKHALRIIAIQPELRYWIGTPGSGHFFGVHAQAARYNLKWNGKRYQDMNRPVLGGGIGYGYSLPFNETWAMELNLGAGYMNTKYNTYHNIDNGACISTQTKNYWGITRLGISIIYKLQRP